MAVLRRALDAGVNVVDTAPDVRGRLLRGDRRGGVAGRRDGVFVIDKIDHLDRPVGPQLDGEPGTARTGVGRPARRSTPSRSWRRAGGWQRPAAAWPSSARRSPAAAPASAGSRSHHPEVLAAALASGALRRRHVPGGAVLRSALRRRDPPARPGARRGDHLLQDLRGGEAASATPRVTAARSRRGRGASCRPAARTARRRRSRASRSRSASATPSPAIRTWRSSGSRSRTSRTRPSPPRPAFAPDVERGDGRDAAPRTPRHRGQGARLVGPAPARASRRVTVRRRRAGAWPAGSEPRAAAEPRPIRAGMRRPWGRF